MNKELLDGYMNKIMQEKDNFEKKYEEEPAYIKFIYFVHYIINNANEYSFCSSTPLKKVY